MYVCSTDQQQCYLIHPHTVSLLVERSSQSFICAFLLSLPLACLWHIFMRKSHRLCVHAFGRKVSKMTLFPFNDACSTQPEMTTICAVLRYSTFLKVIVKTYAYWSKITETVRILRQFLHSLQRHNIRILLQHTLQHIIVTSILRRRDLLVWLCLPERDRYCKTEIESESGIALAANEWRDVERAKYRHYHLQRSMRRFNGSWSHFSEEAWKTPDIL